MTRLEANSFLWFRNRHECHTPRLPRHPARLRCGAFPDRRAPMGRCLLAGAMRLRRDLRCRQSDLEEARGLCLQAMPKPPAHDPRSRSSRRCAWSLLDMGQHASSMRRPRRHQLQILWSQRDSSLRFVGSRFFGVRAIRSSHPRTQALCRVQYRPNRQ